MTKLKILIVEDERFLSNALETKLIRDGFDVRVEYDGDGGLRLAKEFEPDLILLDLKMPGVDGFSFLQHFEDKKLYPKSKVIVFSNSGLREDVDRAMSMGVDKYATKADTSMQELRGMIEELLK